MMWCVLQPVRTAITWEEAADHLLWLHQTSWRHLLSTGHQWAGLADCYRLSIAADPAPASEHLTLSPGTACLIRLKLMTEIRESGDSQWKKYYTPITVSNRPIGYCSVSINSNITKIRSWMRDWKSTFGFHVWHIFEVDCLSASHNKFYSFIFILFLTVFDAIFRMKFFANFLHSMWKSRINTNFLLTLFWNVDDVGMLRGLGL